MLASSVWNSTSTRAAPPSRAASFFPPFCVDCGDRLPPLPARAIACPSCGSDLVPARHLKRRPASADRPSSPKAAALLSLFLPGAGQVYNGQFLKGFLILATCWLIVPWGFGIIDAYRTAQRESVAARA